MESGVKLNSKMKQEAKFYKKKKIYAAPVNMSSSLAILTICQLFCLFVL